MKKILSFVLVFALVLSCFSIAFAETTDPTTTSEPIIFKDVTGTGFETAVTNLVSKGIVNGYEDQTFRPLNWVTRAEACKIVVLATKPASTDLQNTAAAFNDMTGSTWANPYVNLSVSKGIITGYENDGVKTFKPRNNVTYDEMNAMLVRALGIKESSLTGTWPENYAAKAKELGIHKGLLSSDGKTSLSGNYGSDAATRGNVAIMVNNVIDQLEAGTTPDTDPTDPTDPGTQDKNVLSDYTGRAYGFINGTASITNSDKEKVGQLAFAYGEAVINVEMKSGVTLPSEGEFLAGSLYCLTLEDGIVTQYTKVSTEIQDMNEDYVVLVGDNEKSGADGYVKVTDKVDNILVHYNEYHQTADKTFVLSDQAKFYTCVFEDGKLKEYKAATKSDLRANTLIKAYTINEDGEGTAQVVLIVKSDDVSKLPNK